MGKTYEEAQEETVLTVYEWWMETEADADEALRTAFRRGFLFGKMDKLPNPSAEFQEKIAACKPAPDDPALRLEALRLAVELVASGALKGGGSITKDYAEPFHAFLRGEK